MIHQLPGQVGHFLVIVALVTSLLASWAFFQGIFKKDNSAVSFGKYVFWVHCVAIIGVVVTLFYMISNHYFEYHYVFSHSSKTLPVYYQISCFWEGQEGSFLLWMFWNALLGLILMKINTTWKAPVMFVLTVTQFFLTSMILGVVVFGAKIGSSPFMLLRDVLDAPIFKTNPNFIPEDGNGLNPLLQNYWMVIHPPMLFLGFALTVVPFAYCIGGLMTGRVGEWLKPALPWAQFGALILGVGILMGAYWAYETLNFGGYWNWDPVENAVYVPWLVLVASIHVMIVQKKNGSALKSSIILTIAAFILILYSTFLTRSGILGNASVHSFTDLGLSGQLIIYLIVFVIASIILSAIQWKKIPTSKKELSAYSREFWVFIGAVVLCLMAFQVLFGTSIPVYNAIAENLGFELNMAPATDTYKAYSFPQLIFAVFIALLSGTAQFFWWQKMDKSKLKSALKLPFLISLIISAAIITIFKISKPAYMILLIAGIYSVVTNVTIFISLAKKKNLKLTGGAITHIGIALMLLGILFSSGYSKILSKNYTTMVWSNDFPEEVNRDNLLLFLNEPRQMHEYKMLYRGTRKLTKEKGMVPAYSLEMTENPLKMKLKGTQDTLTLINFENSYFEIDFYKNDSDKKSFTLFPRVQMNEEMSMTVYSPDIVRNATRDIYTHVRTHSVFEEDEWKEGEKLKSKIGSQFFVNDYVATLEKIVPLSEINGKKLEENDVAVKAVVQIQGEYKTYTAEPIFIIKNQKMVGRIEAEVPDLAIRLTIDNILPDENAVIFNKQQRQKDWIIIESVEKPMINLLWIGTFLLIIGFSVAIKRRYADFIKERAKLA